MKIIDQSFEYVQKPLFPLLIIELCGRTAYQSQDKITPDSDRKFVEMILSRGHDSVLEHVSITMRLITSRAVCLELVRHRLASFTMESQRYVRYEDDCIFIKPVWFDRNVERAKLWQLAMQTSEFYYKGLLKGGASPQEARDALPNATKAEIVITANVREWRHILKLRTSSKALPQMRELMIGVLNSFQKEFPVLFDNIYI